MTNPTVALCFCGVFSIETAEEVETKTKMNSPVSM